MTHANATSYMEYVSQVYEVTSSDRFGQCNPLAFDLSVHDMFCCWGNGASLCVPVRETVFSLASFISQKRLTMWLSVPNIVSLLSKVRALKPSTLPTLRCSLFCGEPLTTESARIWELAASSSIIENLYGPTEATIAITRYRWDRYRTPRESENGIVPIGWVFPDHQYILEGEQGTTAEIGKVGELLVSGPQVTGGYINDTVPAAGKESKFTAKEDGLWYRTGDLVRRDSSDCLHYVGRIDDQMKIAGARVELPEIESALRLALGDDLCFAVPWPRTPEGAAGVVGIVFGQATVSEHDIQQTCRELLPDYLIPTKIHFIDGLPPVNSNGKVDRSRLLSVLEQILLP